MLFKSKTEVADFYLSCFSVSPFTVFAALNSVNLAIFLIIVDSYKLPLVFSALAFFQRLKEGSGRPGVLPFSLAINLVANVAVKDNPSFSSLLLDVSSKRRSTDAVPLSEGHMPKDRMQKMPATVQHEVQEENITPPVGQNATMKCLLPGNLVIKAVNVTRDDLGDEYVAYLRDEHMDPGNQHRSFENRVELLIKQGKLFFSILNVSSTDKGSYKIRIKYNEGTIQTKHICTFNLTTAQAASVASAGNILKDNGRFGSIAAVVVVAVVVVG
ncbi:uncharacterized protein LOC122974212 isoform X2 [Thunnus albacares]|uniref:uncharacterized protein LOC122974212 isoform X2 n=1 Tax=Thunnus albacares TaxID=8236 RepID=UPI001CF614E6|nr:uncharacterized protein LOC122974212 isoform X2 [Thunnus albacares]